jgi:hypothetical protein
MKSVLYALRQQPQFLLLTIGILGLAAYCLPWLTNPGVGLSFGAYDLAEWSSLHPAVRSGNPMLLTSFLLRLPLATFGLIVGAIIFKKNIALRVIFVVLVAIALLPPLEFFTQYRDDPNYQQQFTLAILTAIVGLGSIAIRSRRWDAILWAICAMIGAISGLAGLIQGYNLMQGFELPTALGLGGIGFILLNLGVGALILWGKQPVH